MSDKILKSPNKKILQFPGKPSNENKIIYFKRGIKMTENAELLKIFLDTFGCVKNKNNCVIKICPEEIEEKCGVEVRNFIMKNLVFDKGNEDYKEKFFGYAVRTKPHYKYESYKIDYAEIEHHLNSLCKYITFDYYDMIISRQDYEELQEKIF